MMYVGEEGYASNGSRLEFHERFSRLNFLYFHKSKWHFFLIKNNRIYTVNHDKNTNYEKKED